MKKQCSTCEFWAQYGDGKGECGMVSGLTPESRVTIMPKISEEGETLIKPISADDERFKGLKFFASMITPHDFGCESWQERTWDKNEAEDDNDESDWWKQ